MRCALPRRTVSTNASSRLTTSSSWSVQHLVAIPCGSHCGTPCNTPPHCHPHACAPCWLAQVERFLYRQNLRSAHAVQRVGFLFFAYSHECVIARGHVPLRETQRKRNPCASLYAVPCSPRGRYWYYELVDMARRVSLTGVVLFSESAQAQLVIGMAVAFAAVCAHQVWRDAHVWGYRV